MSIDASCCRRFDITALSMARSGDVHAYRLREAPPPLVSGICVTRLTRKDAFLLMSDVYRRPMLSPHIRRILARDFIAVGRFVPARTLPGSLFYDTDDARFMRTRLRIMRR